MADRGDQLTAKQSHALEMLSRGLVQRWDRTAETGAPFDVNGPTLHWATADSLLKRGLAVIPNTRSAPPLLEITKKGRLRVIGEP